MPYSDNLYSANDDESDTQSISNELSPTDGFFNPSPMAASRMVPDPSLDRKDAAEEDKVLIPRSETRNESGSTSRSATSPTLEQLFPSQNYASSQSNNRPRPAPSSSSNTPTSPVSRRRTENQLFEDPRYATQGPPPAYTPSSPTTSSHSNHNRSYSTFESQQVEQAPVAPVAPSNTEPQSMGRPSEEADERAPLINEIKKPSRKRACMRKVLFVALVFAVVIAIMTTLANLRGDTKDSNLPGGKLPDDVKRPDVGLPDGSSSSYCASATIKQSPTLFDITLGEKIGILQQLHNGDNGSDTRSVRTSGEIKVKKLPKDSKYRTRGVVSVETYVSDSSLEVLQVWDENSRAIVVSVPRWTSVIANNNCISLEITLWLPEYSVLSELEIASTVLTLRVFDDVKVKVTGDSAFASISGGIYFPDHGTNDRIPSINFPLDSRHITVETISGNIKGIYPLYDYLKLSSQSGNIQAGIFPQAVLPSEPEPAVLEVSTASGKIEVGLPVEVPRYTPPARDYVTRVSSVSGHIKGSIFLGSLGSLKSTSGDITAKILPVIQYSPSTDPEDAPETKLDTWSVSGRHDLDIMEPVFISLLPTNDLSSPNAPKTPKVPDTPVFPKLPEVPNVPNVPSTPSNPEQHHSPKPYIPIGDGDPYRDILSPEMNEDVILGDLSSAKMFKRRFASTKKWRTLKATHKTSSANIILRYPVAWEGTVVEQSISGDTKIDGKDLKLISAEKGWPYKKLVAGKGASRVGEGSSVTMDCISGDLEFIIMPEE